MPRWPTPIEETDEATAMHDSGGWEVPEGPLSPETKLWLREQLKKKGVKFAESSPQTSETASSNAVPVTPDAPEGKQPSQPSFADGSPLLQELKQELLARGMSDAEAEAYLRQL